MSAALKLVETETLRPLPRDQLLEIYMLVEMSAPRAYFSIPAEYDKIVDRTLDGFFCLAPETKRVVLDVAKHIAGVA